MTEPTRFPVPASTEIVPLLTHLLDLAKAGEIASLGVVAVKPSGGMVLAISDPGAQALQMVGACGALHHRALAQHDKGWDVSL